MEVLSFLAQSPAALVASCFLLGLLVGSFLNVVILRLPKMLEASWKAEAAEILEVAGPATVAPRLTLVSPGSRCPACEHRIRWFENIPVLSWALLRGRCSQCRTPISARYPVVELLSALVTAAVAAKVGFGEALLPTMAFSWALLALAVIDLDTTLLPDQITLPLLWGGLLVALAGLGPVALPDAVTGAVAGYLSLWTVYWLFRLVTGKEGMGHGDFKLLAALGAWLGWKLLPLVILLSSVVGAVFGIALILCHRARLDKGIPFGPYLAAAGWIGLLWGEEIVSTYIGLFRF